MRKCVCLVLCLCLLLCLLPTGAEEGMLEVYDSLQAGDKGEDVLRLQTRLKEIGFYSGPLSGEFASLTRNAVKAVQKAYDLDITGIADSDTQTVIFGDCYKPLSYNDTGDLVRKLQNRLKELGYFTGNVTGNYYDRTKTAVTNFQDDFDLPATGSADVNMLALLYSAAADPTPVPPPVPTPAPTPTPVGMTPAPTETIPYTVTLAYGSTGEKVSRVQERLQELGFFTYRKITTGYYKNTQAAVKAFQRMNGLEQTGTVDELTWNILFNDPEVADAAAVTPRPSPEPTPLAYFFEVDVANQVTKVWKYDTETQDYTILHKAFLCATGTTTYPSPLGTFTLSGRRAKYCMFPTWGGGEARYWTKINSEIAFHSVLYSDAGDDTTLKVSSLKGLGKRGSHGCIRLTVADAKWIYENAKSGMKVWIHDDAAADPELVYAIQPGAYDANKYAPKTTPAPTPYPVYDGTKVPEGEIRTLKLGSSGEDVYWLQMKLKEMGYYTGTVTGQYREGTQKAVSRFQRANEIEQTGTANTYTLKCLYKLVQEANATPTPAPTPVLTPTPAPTVLPTLGPIPTKDL